MTWSAQQDESFYFAGEVPQRCRHRPLRPGSLKLRSHEEVGHPDQTWYLEGVDYAVDAAKGEIVRLPDGRLPGGEAHPFYGLEPFDHIRDWRAPGRSFMVYGDYEYENENEDGPGAASEDTVQAGAGHLEASLRRLSRGGPFKIGVLGDSICLGSDLADRGRSFAGRLVRELAARYPAAHIELDNRAVGGESSGQGLARLLSSDGTARWDLVVIGFGMNDQNLTDDGGNFVPTDRFAEHLTAMIDAIRARTDAGIALLTPCLPNPRWRHASPNVLAYAQTIRRIGAERRVAVADAQRLFLAAIDAGKTYESLLVNHVNHPSVYGHALYAEALIGLFGQTKPYSYEPPSAPVELGSQLFINAEDTPEEVRAWVRQMADHGLKLIRLFMIWEQLEPTQGDWRFEVYDACFDEAEARGLRVVPTLMVVSPPGWLRMTDGPQGIANLDESAQRARMSVYIGAVVQRYARHPALHSWILWNEPSRKIRRGPQAMAAYAEYARSVYGTIEAYNRISYWKFASFEQLAAQGAGADGHELPFISFAERTDWARFSVDNLNSILRFIRDEVRRWDAVHPVHINPHNLQGEMQQSGQSVWAESESVDFLGCSAHPAWHSLRFPERRWGQSVAFFADLTRSASGRTDELFWVTELQGGPTLYSASVAHCPAPAEIRQWIWEGIGAGARAVVFWCFNARKGGYEAAEWSLLDQLGEPSPRLAAVRETASILEREAELFAGAGATAPCVYILYSEASCALGNAEGSGSDPSDPRNANMYLDAIAGAYLMLSDLSIPAGFINEKRLRQDGVPAGAAAVIVPGAIVLGRAETAALADFAARGGLVVGDGLLGMKNADGGVDREALADAGALFGARAAELETAREGLGIRFEPDGARVDGWFYRLPLAVLDAEPIARFEESGAVAATIRRHGAGAAIRIGTLLFQRYFASPSADGLALLAGWLDGRLQQPVRLANSDRRLRLRRLTFPQGELLVLLNEGGAAAAELEFAEAGQLHSLTSPTAQLAAVVAGGTVRVPVASHDVEVLSYTRTTISEGGTKNDG
ncbi:beta-galactosidase [Cohnella sp. 56]|uniref:beta-galactosidase n=1 Tax=Cohnella sp. 56 TaxID=3113722 RepID=UPI0030E8DFBD